MDNRTPRGRSGELRPATLRWLFLSAGVAVLLVVLDGAFGRQAAGWLFRYHGPGHEFIRRLFGQEAPQTIEWYLQQVHLHLFGLQVTFDLVIAWLLISLAAFPRWLCLVCLGMVGFGCVFLNGFDGLVLFDHSLVVDGAWRILQGQVPYRDFVFPAGLLLFVFQGMVFLVFGVSLVSMVIGAGILSAVGAWLAFGILHRLSQSNALGLTAALVTIACSVFQLSIPWHGDLAWLFVLGAVYLLVVAQQPLRPAPFLVGAGCCCALACLSKQNIGFAATILLGAMVWWEASRWKRLGWFMAGWMLIAGLFGLWLSCCSDVGQFLQYFFLLPLRTGRLSHVADVQGMSGAMWLPLIGSLVIVGCLVWQAIRTPTHDRSFTVRLAVALTLLQWFSLRTSAAQTAYASGVLLGLLYAHPHGSLDRTFWHEPRGTRFEGSLLVGLLACAVGYFLLLGTSRRIFNYAFLPWGARTYALKEPRLSPLRMDPFHGEALDEVIRYLKTRLPPHDTLLVFADATLLYGITGRTSTSPLLWFHHGVSYFPGDGMDERLCETVERERVKWVVLDERPQLSGRSSADHLRFFPQFRALLQREFVQAEKLKGHTVLVKAGR